jgi:hypothetical protein
VTARLDLFAPATITAFSGGVTSLFSQPPDGIFVQDPGTGELSLTLTAANAGTSFAASNASGATISAHGNILVISGGAAQVNAALQTLQIFEPIGATADNISLVATEPGELATTTAIAVNVALTGGPAFVSPPQILDFAAYSLDFLPNLIIGDPQAQSLIAAGLGAQETMQVTLSVVSGLLLMPNFSPQPGITASGLGSNAILLTFTADELAEINNLLSQLTYIGPAATTALFYQFSNLFGPLPPASTSGNIQLNILGTEGGSAIVTVGADTLIAGPETFGAGQTITVTAVTSDLGGIAGAPAMNILPDASFVMPYNTLDLGGTSIDDGTLTVDNLNLAGSLIAPGEIVIGGLLNVSSGGFIDFSNTLAVATLAQFAGQSGLSIAAGAVVTGNGTILAGNFSNAGGLYGPGTLLAAGGDTLAIAAADIAGGMHMQIGGGAELNLGPIAPLFGVFAPTPITIDASDTISFLAQASPYDYSNGYNDFLDQRGGLLVINSPADFFGTIVNFAPGDRLVFPGLSGLSLSNVTSNSFVVTGTDSSGTVQTFTINASYPPGTIPSVAVDENGDGEINVQDTQTDFFVGSLAAGHATIFAQPGYEQPIIGLTALLQNWQNQTLKLKLSVAAGTLADGTLIPGATLTLIAASPQALNAELAGLQYTPNGVQSIDTLRITGIGYLAGATAAIPIDVTVAPGTVAGFGDAAELSLFAGDPPLIQIPGAPGAILVTGDATFADAINVSGLGGTALVVDAGGMAILDGGASAFLQGNVTVGDSTGAGYFSAFSSQVTILGNLIVGGNAAAAGSQAVLAGTVGFGGGMVIGTAAAASVYVEGALLESLLTVGAAGTLALNGTANAALGAVADSGVIVLTDIARANASGVNVSGSLVLDGYSAFFDGGNLTAGGLVLVGPDAFLSAAGVTQGGIGLLLEGILSTPSFVGATAISLAGGTLIAQNLTMTAGTITGSGEIEGKNTLASITLSNAAINDTGSMDIGGDLSLIAGGKIFIGPNATLQLDHAVTGGSIAFAGTGAVLTIDDAQKLSAAIINMTNSDVIDLIGIAPSEITNSSGTITIEDGTGALIDSFTIKSAPSAANISIVSDGHGGAFITRGGQLPCFSRGTRLLTPEGYRPVECLLPGDPVITLDGRPRAIKWLGHRTMDLFGDTPDHPIAFAPGSISPGIPARPVRLSPLHAVFIDGVLIPALHLVNGATITWRKAGPVTYFHIELERHDIVFADAMPVETFLENGNRGHLYEERGSRAHCTTPCAPLITTGPKLAKIRRRLHHMALAAGYTLTYDAALRGIAAQTSLLPKMSRRHRHRFARFTLPKCAEKLALAARAAAPADTDPDSEDRRTLGICLAAPPAGATLGAGWLPRGEADAGFWMPGGAEIFVPPGATELVLDLAAVIRTWRPAP